MSYSAQLVLLTGSHAGIVAAIHPGYYLVGRSSHCQIRPKTRSVSRQHCLLYFGSGNPQPIDAPETSDEADDNETVDAPLHIHVMDLGSTSGTQVDRDKISVRKWRQVPSGGELRCGKIAWRVVVNTHQPPVTPPLETGLVKRSASEHDAIRVDDSDAANEGNPSPVPGVEPEVKPSDEDAEDCIVDLVKGQAWQGETVAAFLAGHDEVDRKQRRKKILATVRRKEALTNEFGLAHENDVQLVDETELETQAPKSPGSPSPGSPSPRSELPTASTADTGQSKGVAAKKRKTAWAIPHPTWGTVKLALALALAIAVIGFGIYRIILFRSGPPVRVYRGIGWKSHETGPLRGRCGAVGISETHESIWFGDQA